ncbi:hypothetical protein GCM10023310_00270 [Paenibacillus vulneris]|uniref:WW domain-containing protein n=1 Tax=Paenibacillus vulneris TaxID=1133364 RepID=A0ABW3UXP8_9BACL
MRWMKALAGTLFGIQAFAAATLSANAEMFPTDTPESGRVPSVISLLADTPYFDKYENSWAPPEGVLAPQDVEVVIGGMPWSSQHNWWKIHTKFGDKWINVQSQDLDVPPPKTITLLDNTPIYAKPDAAEEPTAVLSPQDVTVVGAQKQWFAEEGFDNSTMKWLQIHTTWLGDQWVQLPLNRIGSVRSLDEKAYFLNEENLRHAALQVTGEFVSPFYNSLYRVEMDNGPKWISSRGMKITETKESIKLNTRTTLFVHPYPYDEEAAILEPQTVESFERIERNSYGNTPDDPVWYHVHTSSGDGWVNNQFADPIDTKPAEVAIQLNANTELMSYPTSGIWYKFAQLSPQIVHPSLYWDDKLGNRWYQIDSYVGKTWFRINPYTDRILQPGSEQAIQISFYTLYYNSAKVNGDELLFQERKVGYKKEGSWYVSAPFLSEGFRYTVRESEGTFTLESNTGYGFRVTPGSNTADTMWQGNAGSHVKLIQAPERLADGELYLNIADARTLFGSLISEKGSDMAFWLQAYHIAAPSLPQSSDTDSLELVASLTDNIQLLQSDNIQDRPKLVVAERGNLEHSAVEANAEWVAPLRTDQVLYQYKAVRQLKPGTNELRASIKIGERILWQQDFQVTRTTQAQ